MPRSDNDLPPPHFRPPARVTIVAGKGGVGKTTVSAALARLAARSGIPTLIVEVEGRSGLPLLFGQGEPLSYEETLLCPAGALGSHSAELRARTLTPDDALVEYLEDHGMRRVLRRLTSTGTLEVVATAIPGIKDILVLGKVKQLEAAIASQAEGAPGFIVVDAPAAGHAVSFLASAYGLIDAAAVGPIRSQASDVVALLGDPSRCQVMLVTIPEETPVNEAADTALRLQDRAGVQLGPVVVNGVWPHLQLAALHGPERSELGQDWAGSGGAAGLSPDDARRVARAAEFRSQRQYLQEQQMFRLAERLPLPQVRLPFLFSTELGPDDLGVLADELGSQLAALEADRR